MATEMKKSIVKMNKPLYLGASILVKRLCITFGMITLNQSMG